MTVPQNEPPAWIVTPDGERYAAKPGGRNRRPIRRASRVETRYEPSAYDPTVSRRKADERWTFKHTTVRVEQTAELAAELGLWQPQPDELMVGELRAWAANELCAIWDRMPGVGPLTRMLPDRPIAWSRGGPR